MLCVTPLRFSTIEIDIYRGAYPTLRNFRFFRRLQLKHILSLTPETPTADLVEFCSAFEIECIHFSVSRLNPLNGQLQAILVKAINTLLSLGNSTVYIHCLDGRRITGLLVLLLRRLQGYPSDFSLSEFWRYQDVQTSTYEEGEQLSRELDKFVNEISAEFTIPKSVPRYLWGGDRSFYVHGLKVRHVPPLEDQSPLPPRVTSYAALSAMQGDDRVTGSTKPLGSGKTSSSRTNLSELGQSGLDSGFGGGHQRAGKLAKRSGASPFHGTIDTSREDARLLEALDLAQQRFAPRK